MKTWEEMTDAERAPLIKKNAEASERRIAEWERRTGRTSPARGGVTATGTTRIEGNSASASGGGAIMSARLLPPRMLLIMATRPASFTSSLIAPPGTSD